jgi:hypothetical protein
MVARRRVIPSALFLDGEEGNYSDIKTYATNYFSDAGTTPADLEDTIQQINDQSGNGVNWSQATAGQRGKLSARYNLLERTEELDTAPWNTTAGVAVSDVGTINGKTIWRVLSSGSTNRATRLFQAVEFTGLVTVSLIAKPKSIDGINSLISLTLFGATSEIIGFSVEQGVFITTSQITSLPDEVHEITALGDGFWRLVFTVAVTNGTEFRLHPNRNETSTAEDRWIDVVDAQLTEGSKPIHYQRVTTATDYDSVGFDPYLQMDRVDDNYACTLPAGDYTVFIATRKGILIDEVTHAGGTFTVGPTTYTGGAAGALDPYALGDVTRFVGPPVLRDAPLTAAQKAALVQWAINRGAGSTVTEV